MKHIMEFGPEDHEELNIYYTAVDTFTALEEFRAWLHSLDKHSNTTTIPINEVWDTFHEICGDCFD